MHMSYRMSLKFGENLEVWFKLILNVFIKLIVVVNRRTWLE